MHSFQLRPPSRSTERGGFTLIELLVVIAIIAILAAIIFPVFSTVRENAREATTMSSMHDISSALALYKLDNRRYPDVLFAYACTAAESGDATFGDGCNPADTMANIGNDANATNELVGLYPEYIKNWQDFTCPNNQVTTPGSLTPAPVALNVMCPRTGATGKTYVDGNDFQACSGVTQGQLAVAHQVFFAEDAMDISPQVVNQNQFAGGNNAPANWTFLPRYQTSWISYDNGTNGNASDPDYIRQLRWQNPPANTYVTSVTYHVPNSDRLLVLYESGYVKKQPMPSSWFSGTVTTIPGYEQGFIDNQPTIAAAGAQDISQANFWRYDGNQ